MKGGGPPQRVSSSPCPGEELPLWSKIIPACPIPLGRLKLIRLKDALHIEKSPQSVDTERGNEYNTYRVRPKRSAIYEQVFSPIRGITALRTAGRLFFSDCDCYRLYFTLQRNKKHDNQLNHTSHLLSDGVLTAVLPYVLYL